LFLEQ